MSTKPVVKKSRGISVVWLLPVLALSICGWLLYQSHQNAGVDIEIYFDDASGIVADKTLVMVKGIRVGIVKDVKPDFEKKKIKTIVNIDKVVAPYLVEDTTFWVVRPELSAAGVEGLDTIFSGSYIGVQTGSSKIKRYIFQGAPHSPPISKKIPGLHLTIKAEKLGSIQKGTGIYYRNVEIGSVEQVTLDGEQGVALDIYIKEDYVHLVHSGSRFCNVSGLTIGGSLSDIQVHVESFAALLKGGILLHTPKELLYTPLAQNGNEFDLYEDLEDAEFGLELELQFPSSSDIVENSTKLIFRGVELGFVREVDMYPGNETGKGHIVAKILLDPRAEKLLREGSRFWMVEPQISTTGIENLQTLISGSYITFEPTEDVNAPYQNKFEIMPVPPAIEPLRDGKSFYLVSEDADFSRGAPVYFKSIKVGEVVDVKLRKVGREVETQIYIYEEHLNLLSSNTVFWRFSGVKFKADFSGIDLDMSPLEKVMAGGVGFTTPDKLKKKKNEPPEEDQRFTLYQSYKEAVDATPTLQVPGKFFKLYAEAGTTLHLGSPINHKNVNIGKVVGFDLAKGARAVLIECFVEEKYEKLVNSKTRFYDTSGVTLSGSLSGFDVKTGSMQSIIAGGVSCFTASQGKPKKGGAPYPLYKSFQDAFEADDELITVHFKDLAGLKKGAPVMYHGVQVGEVTTLKLGDDLASAYAKLRVDDKVKALFRTKTKIWLEQAEIGLTKMSNLQSIVFGPSVVFLPGKGSLKTEFEALDDPPVKALVDGFTVVLETPRRGSISIGSPVYYRQVQVGEVVGYNLSSTFQYVEIYVTIQDKYKTLIRENTHFWNASGISVDAGIFSGVNVYTESFETILAGGIAFATPEKETGVQAKAGQRFTLYDEMKESWLGWSPDMAK